MNIPTVAGSVDPANPGHDRSLPAPLAAPTALFEGSRRELVLAIVGCLREKGFPMAEPVPGDYSWRMPDNVDHVSYTWAQYDCMMAIGDIPAPTFTDGNLQIMYERDQRVAACVRGFGILVPDPPSFPVYAAAWRDGHVDWYPTMNLTDDHPRVLEIRDKCDAEILQPRPFER